MWVTSSYTFILTWEKFFSHFLLSLLPLPLFLPPILLISLDLERPGRRSREMYALCGP